MNKNQKINLIEKTLTLINSILKHHFLVNTKLFKELKVSHLFNLLETVLSIKCETEKSDKLLHEII